jgi:polyisoprenoid-binding protein YceI
MADLDMGQAIATHFARSAEWFDVERHPEARFSLDRMRPRGNGRWLAEGALEIRGERRRVSAPLRLELSENRARAVGETTVSREAFGLGRGLSEALVDVGSEVRVLFDLVARPASARK